jgi:hypothetical protein
MELFAIVLVLLGIVTFLSAFALLLGVAILYAVMDYLERKE